MGDWKDPVISGKGIFPPPSSDYFLFSQARKFVQRDFPEREGDSKAHTDVEIAAVRGEIFRPQLSD